MQMNGLIYHSEHLLYSICFMPIFTELPPIQAIHPTLSYDYFLDIYLAGCLLAGP